MSASLLLDGRGLTPAEVAAVARHGRGVSLAPAARARVIECHGALLAACTRGDAVYGATTGVGTLDGQRVFETRSGAFQASLLRSHAMGVGEPASEERVRAMMVVRASQLAMGRSGISPRALDALVAMIDRGVTPVVPSGGSVGASDLSPLAHAALPLLGEGAARFGGHELRGGAALDAAGIERPALNGRDALAWINAPADALGMACLLVVDGESLLDASEVGAALSMAALGCHKGAMDPRLVAEKPHPGAVKSAARLWAMMPNAGTNAREPLSIRNVHYIVGAARDALETLRRVLAIELSAAADNPVWQGGDSFFGGGAAFDTHRLAQVLDGFADALCPVASAAERRVGRLLDPATSGGLPAFLVGAEGEAAAEASGLMIAQYTAVSLIARMRARFSASTLSMPTCAGFEDAVSMAPLAAERARDGVCDSARVVAIEHIAAAQAIDLGGWSIDGPLRAHHRAVRDASAFVDEDRSLAREIEALATALVS